MKHTIPNVNMVYLKRVQHDIVRLWDKYALEKKWNRGDAQVNEKLLFHGTRDIYCMIHRE